MGIADLLGIRRGRTLLHTGCLLGSYENQEIRNNYELILKNLGFSFITDKELGLDKGFICGSLALDLGMEKDFIMIARKNFKLLKNLGINKIITTCPDCYKTLSFDYREYLVEWDVQVINAISIISKKMVGRRVYRDVGFDMTIHDNPYFSRYCGVVEEVRKLLSLLGHNIVEMNYSKERTIDSGSSGGLSLTNFDLSKRIALLRLGQARNTGVKSLLVLGIRDYEHLSREERENNFGIKIFELSELLTHALGITKIEVKI